MNTPVFIRASDILARLLTVDTDVSGLNASTLQGYVAADFALSSALSGYLLATGSTPGATAAIQPFALGIQTGKISMLSNSTNAFGLFRANGTTQDVYYNSTNGYVGIGRVPTGARLELAGFGSYGDVLLRCINPAGAASFSVDGFGMTVARVTATDMRLSSPVGSAIIAARSLGFANPVMLLEDATAATVLSVLAENNDGRVGVRTNAPTAFMDLPAANATRASLRLRHGVAPTSPNDGDLWTTTAGLYVRINGVTVGPLS